LLRGGLADGSGVLGMQPFDFTIQDPSLMEIAERAMVENKEVKVSYHIPWVASSCSRSPNSDGVVTKIEIIEK